MRRKRDGLVPIREVFSSLSGPVKVIRETSPQELHWHRPPQRQTFFPIPSTHHLSAHLPAFPQGLLRRERP